MEAAMRRKVEGNELYKNKKYVRAAKKYKKALDFFSYDMGFNKEQKAKIDKELKLPCHLNLAACNLILKKWKDVIDNATKVKYHNTLTQSRTRILTQTNVSFFITQ
jgi:FK506-binding protein 4/5